MAANERIADMLGAVGGSNGNDISRATSPGGWKEVEVNGVVSNNADPENRGRTRPRTYPYLKNLPYAVEDQAEREEYLHICMKHLYVAVSAGDFAPGAIHWTREIRGWLSLKFDLPRETRVKLAKLYYELALAPGLDYVVAERFASMFMVLTKRKHYLRPGKDLILDWRPLFKELKTFVVPSESGPATQGSPKRNIRTLTKLCTFAQLYFDPNDIPVLFEEVIPFFSTSFAEGAYIVAGLLNLLLPTYPAPEERLNLQPQHYLPTFFHLWSLVNRSRMFDVYFIDILSRLARDNLQAAHIPFSAFGIFTEEQSSTVFTAILRLIEIPVGQATSAYSQNVDVFCGLAVLLERDHRKHPIAHHMARWIVMSLSPACLDEPNSILANFEGLIQAVETFFHPSNQGTWTKTLSQLVYYAADFFVMRWNREHSGEMEVPEDRRLNDAVKRRFVLCLREVIFMGIFAKSGTAINFSLSTLQSLAYLEPDLILPGALQRIYPAMQGLVEVHRTITAIRALQMLTKVMAQTKGYRCHITALLGLALPGIDPNDLEKTLHTLSYIQAVCYNVPLHVLPKETKAGKPNGHIPGIDTPMKEEPVDMETAVQWINQEVDRFEREGVNLVVNYNEELTDTDEANILRCSTNGLADFVISFLGRVFTLLENLPDASRVKSGSPEESVVNTLPAAFTPLLSSLSPELYEIALNKIARFVTEHVIHQARDAMAFICNALVKINPKKALARLLPDLITAIRTEIDDNGAGSTRTTGSDVYPRDRALVWNISLLSMCVVHVGDAILDWQDQLFDIAVYMQKKCRGIPTVHVSNFIHHLLLNLTVTYTTDYSIYEPDVLERGIRVEDWGKVISPKELTIKWHKPSQEEIAFAIRIFKAHADHSIGALHALVGPSSPIKRDGTGKEWSDEVSRNLVLLRLIVSGVSVLFDPRYQLQIPDIAPETGQSGGTSPRTGSSSDFEMINGVDSDLSDDDDEPVLEAEDEEVKPTFVYETGFPIERGGEQYRMLHQMRQLAGETLHKVHVFLTESQQDDVPCFNSLYMAFRSWFVDVGIERSAHVLDRVQRLLIADIHPFKFSGLRKEYPRPLLVRRANVYHLQRLRHNANPRPKTDLDKQLLLDLAESSVSLYTEIRRTAQSASESAVKCIIGARPLVVAPLLKALEKAVKEVDYPRIKGALFSLLFGSLNRTIGRDWRFAPTLIKAFIEVTGADKPSVQRLASNATFQIMDMSKVLERMVILDRGVVDMIAPNVGNEEKEKMDERIERKSKSMKKKRANVENKKAALALELIDGIYKAHWRKASRTTGIVLQLALRFDVVAPDPLVNLLTSGSIDPHPNLRTLYAGALNGLFSVLQARALSDHDYKTYLLNEKPMPDKINVPTRRDDPNWTEEFLESFAKPETEYYVDSDYPGWLVWRENMGAWMTNMPDIEWDERETKVRNLIGKHLDRHWFSTWFAYMKQEPRDNNNDRFRMSTALLLSSMFDLVIGGCTVATWEDVKELTNSVYGDGSDKHQHRATAEIMGAMCTASYEMNEANKTKIWEFIFPFIRGVLRDGLTPENAQYWTTMLHLAFQGKDPRRAWPIVDWLASFRLDMSSNAAFKESSKIQCLQQAIIDGGWHFQLEKPVLEDFLKHIDHPYKGVREAVGQTISSIYRTRYHESYRDVKTLIEAQKAAGPIGSRPYEPSEEHTATIIDVFDRLEKWRKERPPGQQTPSPYTSASKTVLLWMDQTLAGYECTTMVKFFPDVMTEQLLHMMDIKEDPELQSLAYHVFRHLPNVPHRLGEDEPFVEAMCRIGRTAKTWHQRLRILINIQVIFFRRLFHMSAESRKKLVDCVIEMLADAQHEVRLGASTTLSGMIRCSPVEQRNTTVQTLIQQFTKILKDNPLPKRRVPGTPTPEHSKLILTRHAAVLGLGALIQAFPYTSPPPTWLPEVLATLASRAASDPGTVGKSVKQILADFKKTRQDTWHVDVKAFEPEQLEDLEGVLWKSYFA
ncbi:hypothetical protein NA57DRAFT_29842 [Rhizodiscina lignyota]|uniref:Proteasome activator subunit 4 n=1 Tax=Rhizodiscina lignyota TaxID=1504668 RepID=A0A9P4MB39_9PEZI|nr:hypothetical protein NA57DRAFT_29842 [Rhizodiscina lignyota]